jgi:uncharacterized membrane protein
MKLEALLLGNSAIGRAVRRSPAMLETGRLVEERMIVAPADPAVAIHPFHAALLAGTVPLFLGALLSDIAYASSYEIQWSNFAAWLIVGGMVLAGFALLWALIELIRSRRGWRPATFVMLVVVFVLGLIDSFIHARDAFGSMPDGLVLSVVTALAAIAATGFGFASLRQGREA